MRTLLFCAFVLAAIPAVSQSVPNIDWELGTYANWLYYTGTITGSGLGPTTVSVAGSGGPITGRHTLLSAHGVDPYGGFPVVSPDGGNYSFQLGSIAGGAEAEKVRYYVHIPASSATYQLIYHYAVVMENPLHSPGGQPRMMLTAFDSASGANLPCDSFCYIAGASDPGSIMSATVGPSGDPVYYTPWKSGNFKFNGLGGHTIGIDFVTADCSYGGHGSYAYIDMTAGVFATTMYLTCSPSFTLQGPAGYAGYQWCDSGTYGTTYGTSQNVTLSAPASPVTYAVILTPYPGFGCQDTLYTHVVPRIACAGTPPLGFATACRAAICGDPDTLKASGYSAYCGFSFQWQSSPDGLTWTNIPGYTSDIVSYYNPYQSLFYRCAVTCIASGLVTNSTSVFVPAVVGPGLHTVIVPPDTVCRGASFYLSTCGASTAYNVTTWYGDGTHDNIPLTTTGTRFANFRHHYDFSGTYSVKQILYDGTLAVDSSAFSYHYIYCNTLPISYYFDINGNCTNDVGETNYMPVLTEVDSNGVPVDTVSATAGFYYTAYGNPGTIYAFRPMSHLPEYFTSCPASAILYDTITPYVNLYTPKYFGLSCGSSGGFDLRTTSYVPVTGRYDQWGHIYLRNTIFCSPTPATVSLTFSPKYYYRGDARPLPSSVGGNTLTWNFSTAYTPSAPIDLYYEVWCNSTTGPLTATDTVNEVFTAFPHSGDVDLTNNDEIRVDTVRASCDPNLMDVHPQGYITAGTQLKYVVHFENTGNDTAFNIHVMDTLSNLVDAHSLQAAFTSAAMDVAFVRIGGLDIVKFDFPNINLLDSSHHGMCDGLFEFTINTLPGLPPGTIIPNRAGIYFDDNDVVMTNTVNNIIGPPPVTLNTGSEQKNRVDVYPNPASTELTIKMDNGAYNDVSITDAVGKVLIEQHLDAAISKINIESLTGGLYYITLKGQTGTAIRKFVKM